MKPIEVEVVVDEAGHAVVHVTGAKGTSCRRLTEDVEQALGKVTDRKVTREAHETPVEAKRCARH